MTEAEKGWVAGIIDGEACISAYFKIPAPQIAVRMVELDTIKRLQELTGVGRVTKWEAGSGTYMMWSWVVLRKQDVAALLTELLPYLYTKQDQAWHLLRILAIKESHKPCRPWPVCVYEHAKRVKDLKTEKLQELRNEI